SGGVFQRTDPSVFPVRRIFFVKTTISYNVKDQFKAGEGANPRTKSQNTKGKRKCGGILIRRKKETAMGKKRKTLASDDDIAQTSVVHEDGSNSILQDASLKHCIVYQRRRKKNSSDTNSAVSLSGIFEMVSVLKGRDGTSLTSNQASSLEKETHVGTESFTDSKMDMFQHKESALSLATVPEIFESLDNIKNNVACKIDMEDSDSNKLANQALPIETNLSPELSSNSYQLEAYSIQCEKSRKKEISLSGFSYDIQHICSDVTSICTLQPVAASVDANEFSRVSSSDEFGRIMEVKCDIEAKATSNSEVIQKTESCLDNSGDGHLVSVEGSPKSLPAGQKDECATLLFQLENKVLRDASSLIHSGEASRLGSGDGSESWQSAVHDKNSLDFKNRCNDSYAVHVKEHAPSSVNHVVKDVSSDVTKGQDQSSNLAALSNMETLLSCSRKKLIILDLNGLLADINQEYHYAHKAHKRVGGKLVFKRPFCDDFLKFCFERFHVGVWSSRRRYNVDVVVDFLMGNLRHKLLFCWVSDLMFFFLVNI
ncbi:CPDc, partial [Musa troglodytarum]